MYLAIADVLEVDPGVLLGPDSTVLDLSDSETVLIRCLRSLDLEPHEAILRLSVRG
jgi:hypothetical protein